MKIERIDLFIPPISQYGVLVHFTKSLHDALTRLGVRCRLLVAERENPRPFLESLFGDPPNCTLSFNGLLPDEEGRFFCDLIKIPHVTFLVDPPYRFLPLINSPRTLIASVDKSNSEFISNMNYDRCTFLPHAADKSCCKPQMKKTGHDIVMLASCIDYESIREEWHKKYPLPLCQIMEDTTDILLSDQQATTVEAFIKVINTHRDTPNMIDPCIIPHAEVMDEIENYITGKDRVELIRSIKDIQIDLYGAGAKTAGWNKYVGDQKNVVVHDPIPYEDSIQIICQSKISLSSCAWIRNGGHERIFTAANSKSFVVAGENPYLKQYFRDEKEILYYQYGKWDEVEDKIKEFLSNDAKRETAVERCSEIIMEHHTWDQRAVQLLAWLSTTLPKANP